ncbi:MAG: RDD family protein [Acidobacteria bacterium]|nr:RDD family protein [Acidobacteriota bacterium]
MRNDSVREELQTKITSGPLSKSKAAAAAPIERPAADAPAVSLTAETPKVEAAEKRPAETVPGGPTSGLRQPAKTSPTLVGFQGKETAIPEWRLQMQNAVRQRMGMASEPAAVAAPTRPAAAAARTTAAPASKPRTVSIPQDADPRLAAALGRIQASRHAFSTRAAQPAAPARVPAQKNPRFNVVPRTQAAAPAPARRVLPEPSFYTPMPRSFEAPMPKPFEAPMRIKLDTNKLPKLAEIVPQREESFEALKEIHDEESIHASTPVETATVSRFVINAEADETEATANEFEDEELEDLAPLSMRVNAALFDLIVGIVATLILMSPFVLSGGEWVSLSGGLLFAGALAVVLFLYTTFSVAFVGKTLGMRLFSLEVVDIEENEYPTMQQAAVSSSVFLLSIAFAGLGFVPMFFNPERRAAHDLASGTIVVREF